MLSHSKEYYVLVGFTLIISGLVLFSIIWFNSHSGEIILNDNTTFSDNQVNFTLKIKWADGIDDQGVWLDGGRYHLKNLTDFETLEFNKQYSCSLKNPYWFRGILSEISECKKI